jgi:hypothetical protein
LGFFRVEKPGKSHWLNLKATLTFRRRRLEYRLQAEAAALATLSGIARDPPAS